MSAQPETKSVSAISSIPCNPSQIYIEGQAFKQKSVHGRNGLVYMTFVKTPNPDEFTSGSTYIIKSQSPFANHNERVRVLVNVRNFAKDQPFVGSDGQSRENIQNQTTYEFISRS